MENDGFAFCPEAAVVRANATVRHNLRTVRVISPLLCFIMDSLEPLIQMGTDKQPVPSVRGIHRIFATARRQSLSCWILPLCGTPGSYISRAGTCHTGRWPPIRP